MKETLTCTDCGKNWKRERVRGRKPQLCPKCTTQVAAAQVIRPAKASKVTPPAATETTPTPAVQSAGNASLTVAKVLDIMHPRPTNWKQLNEETANGSQWQCPRCKWILTLSVGVTDVPVHKCSSASKVYPLERIA